MLKFALPLVLLGAALPAAAGNIICCTDARGKQACGDILPSVCVGRAYREIGRNGVVVREVPAPLTAEQRAQLAAEEKRKQEAEAAAKEQHRLDQALLQTYSSEADIETMRQQAEATTREAIKGAEAKIVAAQKRRKKYESEAEFYKNKPLPPEVAKGLKEVDSDIAAQQSVIEARKLDLESIRKKYDEDARRYRALKGKPATVR